MAAPLPLAGDDDGGAAPVTVAAQDGWSATASEWSAAGRADATDAASSELPARHQWRHHPAVASTLYAVLAVAVGVQVAIFGPALLRLSAQVSASLGDTAYASSARTFASLAASAAGPLFDVLAAGAGGQPVTVCRRRRVLPRACHAHMVMGVAAVAGGVGSALIPAATSLGLLYLGLALQGAASGLLDTGSNLLILWLWHGRRAGAPWMQTLHFGFAAGATLAPLLLRAAEAAGEVTVAATAGAATNGTATNGTAANGTTAGTVTLEGGTYRYAFLVLAAMYAVCGVALTTIPSPASPWQRAPAAPPEPVGDGDGDGDGGAAGLASPAGASAPPPASAPAPSDVPLARQTWTVMAIIALFFLLYVGSEHAYGTFLTTYATFVMQRPEAFGQYATAAYWAAMTAGRFGSIGASLLLAPHTLLATAMSGAAAAALTLAAVPGHSEASLLVLSVLFGLCMAPQYPSALALAGSFAPMRAAYTTAFSLANSGGAWLLPFIVASFLKRVSGTADDGASGGSGGDGASGSGGAGAVMIVVAVACAANWCVFMVAWRLGTRLRAALAARSAGSGRERERDELKR